MKEKKTREDLLTKDELASLEACQTAEDWGKACDAIKGCRDLEYPADWWPKVKMSGMMDRIMARWGSDSNLTAFSFDNKADMVKYLTRDGEGQSN